MAETKKTIVKRFAKPIMITGLFAALLAGVLLRLQPVWMFSVMDTLCDPLRLARDQMEYRVQESLHRRRFEAREWRASATQGEWTVRRCMLKDLIQRRLLIGKTKQEVIALLGADGEEYNGALLYALGVDPEMMRVHRFDGFLVIGFDPQGRVVNVDYTKDW